MRFLPLFLDTGAGRIVLAGSGPAALAKLRLLRASGADILWFAGDASDADMLARAIPGEGRFEISRADPAEADWSDVIAVISAAGETADARISQRARALHLPVNVVDRVDLSTFIFPAIVDRGDVVVAVGTGGTSPVLARRLRERIEALLPGRIGELSTLIGRYRELFASRPRELSPRAFWEQVIDGPIGELVLAGRAADAEAKLIAAIDGAAAPEEAKNGTVFLVGAGPGDPDLLTLRASQALADADIVFYDELVTVEILDRARREAERVFVGKRSGKLGLSQDEINHLLVDAAQAGKRVVRLKGGDPFVFGRGGEELEHLRAADVPVVVVPGITAALGCAAEAGLPLTFRNEATQVALITAHRAETASHIDWSKLTDPAMTLVVYMGLKSAIAVRDGLIAAGRKPETPVAVLARGTRPDAQSAAGRLDQLPALAAAIGEGPALLIIGNVVTRSTPWQTATKTKTAAA